jgi:hypothetical protein
VMLDRIGRQGFQRALGHPNGQHRHLIRSGAR